MKSSLIHTAVQALFIVVFEIFIVTALGFAVVTAAIELLMPRDSGAGGLRWVNLGAAWMGAASGTMHIVVATLSKSTDVENNSHLSVAMAYFSGIFILLVVHCVMFVQVLLPDSLSLAEFSRASVNSSSTVVYTVSQRSDWFQAVAGDFASWCPPCLLLLPKVSLFAGDFASWCPLCLLLLPKVSLFAGGHQWTTIGDTATASASINSIGVLVGGAVLGFLMVLFLLACTAAFSAAPEGSPVPLFTDPSLLLCCNIIIMGVATAAVENVYANCNDVLLVCITPVVFLLLACYYDVASRAVLRLLLIRVNQSHELHRVWFLVSMALIPLAHCCPLVGLLVGPSQPTITYTSLTLTVAGCLFGLLAEWKQYREVLPVENPSAASAVGSDIAKHDTLARMFQIDAFPTKTKSFLKAS